MRDDLYRVEIEVPLTGDGQWHYMTVVPEVREEAAMKFVASLKKAGVGGRLVHLDGSAEGTELDKWLSTNKMERQSIS